MDIYKVRKKHSSNQQGMTRRFFLFSSFMLLPTQNTLQSFHFATSTTNTRRFDICLPRCVFLFSYLPLTREGSTEHAFYLYNQPLSICPCYCLVKHSRPTLSRKNGKKKGKSKMKWPTRPAKRGENMGKLRCWGGHPSVWNDQQANLPSLHHHLLPFPDFFCRKCSTSLEWKSAKPTHVLEGFLFRFLECWGN